MSKSLLALALLAGIASAQPLEHGARPLAPEYTLAAGVLAAPDYVGFRGDVWGVLNFRRQWAWAMLHNNSILAVDMANVDVWGDAPSAYYTAISAGTNHGAGTVVGDYRRVGCAAEATGPCIARKTAVRNDGAARYGIWGEQFSLGPNTSVGRYVHGDQGKGDVEVVENVAADLDVSVAVHQWIVSPGSTGDWLRIVKPDGTVLLRITNTGQIVAHDPNVR